jgi:hypothetical protein
MEDGWCVRDFVKETETEYLSEKRKEDFYIEEDKN